MDSKTLTNLLIEAKDDFSTAWKENNHLFFNEEYLNLFSQRLIGLHNGTIPVKQPLPYFTEETTPNLEKIFPKFKDIIKELENHHNGNTSSKKIIPQTIESVPFDELLIIMGQRQTPATIKTSIGLPLTKKQMLESCLTPYNQQISTGVRAWEKHTQRTDSNFWGQIKGTPIEKLHNSKKIITHIIENHTWWNTFHHYKHDIVFEIRVASGHGMRWSKNDLSLIGFLEPFL